MAFDGITVAAVAAELKKDLLNSRIYKIAQPESDELIITLKTTDGGQKRLLLSADASLPLTYFTSQNKPSPMTAPSFTMLLRKHLQNGRITGITQPGLERIIELHVEHYNDMGDLCHKRLIIELMGKHSNIIFVNEELVRLRSHIEATKDALIKGGSIGRKLDFIAQEMNREANTILSKSSDLEISNRAIELKTEIEKVREQIQNIE